MVTDPDGADPIPDRWEPRAWWEAPQDQAPAILPVMGVIASTVNAAVALVGARVYRSGLELQIELRARRREESDTEWDSLIDAFMERPYTPAGPGGAQALTYAVAIDGGAEIVANSLFRPHTNPEIEPRGYSLMRTRPGASGNRYSCTSSQGLWLWPLPDAEHVELIVRWPAMGIGEARTGIDVTPIADLSSRAVPLWN